MQDDRDETKRINKKTPLFTTILALIVIAVYYFLNPGALNNEQTPAPIQTPDYVQGVQLVEEGGRYSDKERVALYLHTFGKLPTNYITKAEAESLGWNSLKNTVNEAVPGMSIGGDRFGNYEELLPAEKGITYKECDIDYSSGERNAKRIVYSNTGWIYYTDDHYASFETLYEGDSD